MNLKNKLKKYSMLASATMGGAIAANAGIVHTDINPDSVINDHGEFFQFDINGDGNGNVLLGRREASVVNGYGTNNVYNFIDFAASSNAAFMAAPGTAISSVSFPIVNSASDLIGTGSNWATSGFAGLYLSYTSYSNNWRALDDGNWSGATNQYMGVRLVDTLGAALDTTYGWIQVSVSADYKTVDLIDYAWQSCPGVPIMAGDMVSRATSTASNLVVSDVNDLLTGDDFQLSFDAAANETLVGRYQVVVVKSSKAGTFTGDSIVGIPLSSRYYVAPTGGNFSSVLSGITTDSDGDSFAFGSEYVVLVVSLPDGTNANECAISAPSNVVKLVQAANPASNVVATDVANNGNGLDMGFAFDMGADESTISEYKVLAVPTANAGSFNVDTANAAAALGNAYSVSKTGSNLAGTFDTTGVDANGALIVNGVDYTLFVLSCADTSNASGNSLSSGSNAITLNSISSPATNLVASDVANNSNGLDLQIAFDMATDESSVLEYRAVAVKASKSSTFDLDSAELAITNMYHLVVAKTGANLSAVFGGTAMDSDGDLIQVGVAYNVFVVSEKTGVATINVISAMSNEVTLNTPASVTMNVVATDASDNNNSSDLQVAFDMGADESNLTEYHVFAVKANDSSSFDLDTANAVGAGNYLTVAKTGANISTVFGTSDNDVDGDAIAQNTNYVLFVMSVTNGTTSNISSLSAQSNTVMLTVPVTTPVTNVVATDVSENSNGTDLQISFDMSTDEANLSEYRAIAVKAAKTATFDLDSANAAVANNYHLVVAKTGANITTTFGAASMDSDGDLLAIGVDYNVFIVSENNGSSTTFSSISSASNNVTLNTTASVTNTVAATDASDNGDATDLQVTFNMGAVESTVADYRVMVVKGANAGTFNLAAAELVGSGNYMSVAPTGSNLSVTFAAGDKDVDGAAIAQGTAYQVFVMSAQNGSTSNISSLSSPSSSITLSIPISVPSNVVAIDVADDIAPSDMEVSFDGIANESNISNYEILVVNSDAADNISAAQLANMISQGYGTEVVSTGSASYTQVLGSWAADENGVSIANFKAYKVFVATKPNGVATVDPHFSSASDEVILKNTTSVSDDLASEINVTSFDNSIRIVLDPSLATKGSVIVRNEIGQTVHTLTINSSDMQIQNVGRTGIYFVTIVTDNQSITRKVSIK